MSSSSGIHAGRPPPSKEATADADAEKLRVEVASERAPLTSSPVIGDHTERRLKARHIQLIGIGGTIGTALYVQIGRGLLDGGPASLFLAFSLW